MQFKPDLLCLRICLIMLELLLKLHFHAFLAWDTKHSNLPPDPWAVV